MLNPYLLIDLVVVIALVGLGLTVFLKDTKGPLNRIFAQFSLFIGIWIIANYVSNDTHNSHRTAKLAAYLVFLFSFAAAVYLLRFAIVLAEDKRAARILRLFAIPLILIGIISCTPLLITGVVVQGSVYAETFGPLLPVYFVGLVGTVAALLYVLARNIKRTNGDQKARLRTLFRSLYIALPALLLTDFILPAVTGWFGLTNIAILTMLIVVYGLYYGVIKHRLFDLRLIAVRSVGYVVALGLIAVIYAVVSTQITTSINNAHRSSALTTTLNTLLIIIVVLAYGPTKKFLERLTNKLFYRDAYDPQEFLDRLNQTIIDTIELNVLLRQAAKVIEENLKCEYVTFIIADKSSRKLRLIGSDGAMSDDQKGVDLYEMLTQIGHKMVVYDQLADGSDSLKRLIRENHVAVAASLLPPDHAHNAARNYLIIGDKRSGNIYNSRDINIIQIIANELVIAIQNALRFEEIESFNLTLQARIDEATRKLRHANDKLKALDETKDDFISMASHQLRTPLTSIKGYLSMVLEGDAGKTTKTQHDMLGQAFASSQRMVYLIADLLNISRLKTGKFVIEPTEVNLAEVIEQELGQLGEAASGRSLKLTYDKPSNFPHLMLDETKTRQVIMNFVDNAIYYTPANGHIAVKLLDNPHSVELRVEDDGIGVPKAEQAHLFTKFYRAGNATKARPDGTGLGLFMAKKVIVAQGGSIIFESKENKGSTFGFHFNKAALKTPKGS
jgi:signal transduction histidine kinase